MSIKTEPKNIDVDFNEICRICFRKSFDFINIFSQSVDNSRHIAYMIMTCASVQVHENDGLPQQICRKCALILNIAFDFKLECEDTDEKLRQYLCTPSSHENIIDIKEEPIKPVIQFQVEQICVNTNSNGGVNLKLIALNDPNSSQVNEISSDLQSDINNTDVKPCTENLNKRKKPFSRRKSSKTSHRVLEVNEEDGSIRRVHQCDICGKTFNRKEYLTQHTRIHTGEKPYHCHLCEKRFINSGHLTTHMRTHTGIKPHHCHMCPKAFSTRQELTKHTMVHNGDRPFQCNVCNKKFGSSSNMYTHLKHHTGEKNFTCEQCGKPFYTKQELKQHLVIHTGEKAFVCNICKKGFAQIAHLRRHSKLHK